MLYNILKLKGKEASAMKKGVLTGNQLKIIALITMTVDHIGKLIFPQYRVLRVIGRLAFPIFAFMIAEGCKYTKSSKSYLASIVTLAAVCQLTYYITGKSLYQNILVTFTLSIILILSIRKARESKAVPDVLAAVLAISAVFVITLVLPEYIDGFVIDYGIWGVLLPVCIYFGETKASKLIAAGVCLVMLSLNMSMRGIQWFSLLSLPLLFCYNNQRGKLKMKKLFYIYYPAHLVVIYGVSVLFFGK